MSTTYSEAYDMDMNVQTSMVKGDEHGERVLEFLLERLELSNAPDMAQSLRDLGVDSFSAMELMYEVEEEFSIEMSREDLMGLRCVGDIVRLVSEKVEHAR